LLPNRAIIPVRTFPELARRLDSDSTAEQEGLMAIENSVAGALLTNYLLLEEHALRIIGEVYLRISHNVVAIPGAEIVKLKTVESHPMALAQCRGWFASHRTLRAIEVYDTAGAASTIAKADDPLRAALAPHWCAEAFGLDVLAKAVEDSPHNWTRFVHVRAGAQPSGGNKTSVAFSLAHKTGSLARVLTGLANAGSSLTKIQSLPIVGKPWSYRFFADFEHQPAESPTELLDVLRKASDDLVHLGTYSAGQHLEP